MNPQKHIFSLIKFNNFRNQSFIKRLLNVALAKKTHTGDSRTPTSLGVGKKKNLKRIYFLKGKKKKRHGSVNQIKNILKEEFKNGNISTTFNFKKV